MLSRDPSRDTLLDGSYARQALVQREQGVTVCFALTRHAQPRVTPSFSTASYANSLMSFTLFCHDREPAMVTGWDDENAEVTDECWSTRLRLEVAE
jgi:hypothetical protein